MIRNYMEDLVETILPEILEGYPNICKCKECLDDIKAKALNQLKPLYFVESRGSVFSKLNSLQSQFETDIVTELIKAIDLISKNPRHENKS